MRPHVELINENDYIWHSAELPGGEGRASERRLSVDEEDGSSSLRVGFHTDWGRGPGIHHANTEYFVVEGSMTYGGKAIGKGGYVYAPKGVPTDAITFAEGSQILHYREYGDAGFDAVDSLAAPRWADAREDVIVIDTEAMKFDAVPNPGPMPGMFIKYLHVDPETGFYTRIVHAQEGWTDHRVAHHPCYEESYTLGGKMEYNFGTLDEGTYFFRPARVKHGHFTTMEGGFTMILRSDGELLNWYTQNEWVRWGGQAVNWGPGDARMTYSQSSHDIAGGRTWRSEADERDLQGSRNFQLEQGKHDAEYVQHGTGTDKSLVALAKALDAKRLQGGHDHDHSHDHDHGEDHNAAWGHGTAPSYDEMGLPTSAELEHPDERTDELKHN
ncbi:MAG TPA: DUF4437 domain-containing protein, partial [Candidatus Nanopelagicales bacterium]|nr:DUF4437 domain-containing protein [Candidatus Nanopelagicales bacterium]